MTTDPQTTRYRHRTTDVEAVQWTGNNTDQLRTFCGRDFDAMDPMEPGDWVVKTDEDFLVFSPFDFATYYEPAVSAVPAVRPELRDQIAEALIAWTYRGKGPEHGGILETVRANAYSRADAVLAVLLGPIPADTNVATWTAVRAIQLMNEAGRQRDAAVSASVDRATVYRELADLAEGDDGYVTKQELRRMAREAERGADPSRMAVEAQQQTETPASAAPLTETERTMLAYALDEAQEHIWSRDGFTEEDEAAVTSLRRLLATQPAVVTAVAGEEPADETQTLAAMFEGLHTLLATSSRDWGTYRVDAWLWAVLCGWDCEQAVHDETCTHSAMEEMQQQHGWDDEAVAKARRYRAVVRAVENRAAVSGEVEAHPPTHTWKVESPRRDKWASWGATHDERVWAAASYDDVIEVAPQRAFRLVRATTTYAVEAEHTPVAVSQPGKEN